MATKPTKQQVAQAKARAGGNNPIKVTNSGLKKLGSAALIAASLTPVGRVARGAATVAKAAKAEGIMAKAAAANARGLKAANKPLSKGNKKLVTQIKQQTGYIAMDRRPTPPTVAAALKKSPKGSFITEAKKIAMQEARSEGPAKKISAAQKMLNDKATALRAAKNKALANSAKGKTQTPTAEAARRRNLNK